MGYKSWFAISFSAVFGILIGIYGNFKKGEQARLQPMAQVYVAAIDQRPPAAIIDKIRRQFKIDPIWRSYSNLDDLTSNLQDHPNETDLVLIYHHQVESLQEQFQLMDLNESEIPNSINIATDFSKLRPVGSHALPVSWFIGGFLYSKESWKTPPTSLSDLFAKLVLLPNNAETSLWALTSTGIVDESWIREDLQEKILAAMKSWSTKLTLRQGLLPSNLQLLTKYAILAPHSAAPTLLQGNPDWDYWIPEKKTQLWIRVGGVLKSSPRRSAAIALLNQILSPAANSTWMLAFNEASTISPNLTSNLPEYLTAGYLRQLPLTYYSVQKTSGMLEALWGQIHQTANWQVLKHL